MKENDVTSDRRRSATIGLLLTATVFLLAGCATTMNGSEEKTSAAVLAEKERFLADCIASYQDLHVRYNALVKETGGSLPDQKGMVDFILDYQKIRENNERLEAEKALLSSDNQKLATAEQRLRNELANMENRLHLINRMVAHLQDSVQREPVPPKSQASPPTQPPVQPPPLPQPVQQPPPPAPAKKEVKDPEESVETVHTVAIKTNPATGGIVLEDTLLFSAGSASISPAGKKLLREVADRLNTLEYRSYAIRIEGHTDNSPVVKTKEINIDNWFLGAKRAHMVLRELLDSGIDQGRLSLASYGEQAPISSASPGDDGNPRNRRVELILVESAKRHE